MKCTPETGNQRNRALDAYASLCKYAFMRTTLDLPGDLLREAKAKAVLEGSTLKKLLTRYIESGLRQMPELSRRGSERSPLPVIPRCGKRSIPNLTPELQAEIEDAEDHAKLHRSFGR